MAKKATRSRGWWDGLNAVDPREQTPAYLTDYDQGAAERARQHALLDQACENGRRAVALGRTGPTSTRFMGQQWQRGAGKA